MPEVTEYKPGTFSWVDLGTTDPDGAKKFYGKLFGWTFNDAPVDETTVYSMAQVNGKDAAALYGLSKEMKSQGIPSHWLSYVTVTSADDTAKKAKELGATIAKDPFDVFDVGRMAVLQDPTGAVAALWEPRKHIGAMVVNEPGSLTWNELLTSDVDKAGSFYTKLFGWSANTQDMGGFMYTSFMNGDRPAGGMMAITKEMGDVPSNWMAYFAVADADKSADTAKASGARILSPPEDIPEIGRFSVLADPQGAAFAIIKLANPPQ